MVSPATKRAAEPTSTLTARRTWQASKSPEIVDGASTVTSSGDEQVSRSLV